MGRGGSNNTVNAIFVVGIIGLMVLFTDAIGLFNFGIFP